MPFEAVLETTQARSLEVPEVREHILGMSKGLRAWSFLVPRGRCC
ncbi:hypothetical protein ACWDOR_25630 [Streptosporangium canum]